MSAQKLKRRAWGKTRPKEGITVVDREKIEETLQTLAEEAKKAPKVAVDPGNVQNASGFDLKYPELMTNEDLIVALKRIKVPIPVYADGRPSRERLLYLYKTNVLPRPQRNRWRGRRRQAVTESNSETGESAMEVDQEDRGNGGNSGTILQRKRKLSNSEMEGISPCKKMDIAQNTDTITRDINTAASSSNIVTSPSPITSAKGNTVTAPSTVRDNSVHRTVRLKRPAISTITSSTSTISISPAKQETALSHITTPACTNTEDTAKAAKKVKITWP